MDAVTEDGLGAEDAVILKALDGTAAVVLEGIVHVVHALGDMDVIAGAAVVGLDHAVEGLIGDGEERVTAEHRREHGILALLAFRDEVGIFLDGLQALLLAVAVGDLIAQAGAQAETLALLGDGVQRAGDLAVAGVVVEHGGDALLDGVDVERGGAGLGAVHHQVAVDGPPRSVEDLVEVCRVVADDGQAARERGIDVGVRVDEGGHDDAALGVDDLGVGVLRAQGGLLADLGDLRALVGDRAVLVVAAALCVAGDETSVGDELHKWFPPVKWFQLTNPSGKKKRRSKRVTRPKRQRFCRSDSFSPCAQHFVTAISHRL